MASPSRLEQEIGAYRAWTDLLAQAERVRNLFNNAEIDVPSRLRRLLGDEPAAPARPSPKGSAESLCPLYPGPVPPEFREGWIVVDEKALTVRVLVLALLRQAHPKGVRSRDLAEKVAVAREGQNLGSVYNLGGQLERAGVIRRGDNTWILESVEAAPVMSGGAAWGPPDVFTKQEVASYRRAAIRYILGLPNHANGLQNMQIVHQLNALAWLKAPVAKDLVKMDIEAMRQAGEVKRGSSRNWRLAQQGES